MDQPTGIPDSRPATDQQLARRAQRFIELHRRPGAFLIPNPWDAGTARLFELLGFDALASTGAGFAFSIGRADGHPSPEALVEHVAAIAAATDLPVSADLEDGFGTESETVQRTIASVADRGVVGGSIEDRHYRDDKAGQLFDIQHAIAFAADAVPYAQLNGMLTSDAA